MAQEIQVTLAKNLKIVRLANRLTQDELAERAGLSRATIVAIESGTSRIELSTLQALEGAVKVRAFALIMDAWAMHMRAKATESALNFAVMDEEIIPAVRAAHLTSSLNNAHKAAVGKVEGILVDAGLELHYWPAAILGFINVACAASEPGASPVSAWTVRAAKSGAALAFELAL